MFLSGVFICHDLAASIGRDTLHKGDAYEDINGQVLAAEDAKDSAVKDIIPLPLRLNFPPHKIVRITRQEDDEWQKVAKHLEGPPEDEEPISFHEVCNGRSVSTYPPIPALNGARDGDPVCDRFGIKLFPQRQIIVVADGCGWGFKPRTAAIKGARAFVEYLSRYHADATNAHYVARLITRAMAHAQAAILEGICDMSEAGTTTLLGGLLVQLEEPLHESGKDYEWGYIAASVGDCKCFLYEACDKSFKDYTASNRVESFSAKDCGGRLGPIDDYGTPDLRNFRMDVIPCNVGDILFLLSDGVHDNLDPRHLGCSPSDLGFEGDVEWESIDPTKVNMLAIEYSENLLTKLIVETAEDENCTPRHVTQNLIKHCIATNAAAAKFMVDNPGKKLPKDYKEFPGKMDHTTCLATRVGPVAKLGGGVSSAPNGNSDEHTGDTAALRKTAMMRDDLRATTIAPRGQIGQAMKNLRCPVAHLETPPQRRAATACNGGRSDATNEDDDEEEEMAVSDSSDVPMGEPIEALACDAMVGLPSNGGYVTSFAT